MIIWIDAQLSPDLARWISQRFGVEAKAIRVACAARDFRWVVPINPERRLAGPKPRAKVKSLEENLSAEHFEAVRDTGSPCVGPGCDRGFGS